MPKTLHSNDHAIKIWLILLVTLLLLFFSGWFLSEKHLQLELDDAEKKSKTDINLLQILVKENLQKRNYKEIRHLIYTWGEKSPEILEITLSSKNGYKMAYYQRADTANNELIETANITYSYTGIAKLKIRRSLDNAIYLNQKSFIMQYLIIYFLISGILFLLVYINIHTHKQKQQLIKENNKRQIIEQELIAKSIQLEKTNKALSLKRTELESQQLNLEKILAKRTKEYVQEKIKVQLEKRTNAIDKNIKGGRH